MRPSVSGGWSPPGCRLKHPHPIVSASSSVAASLLVPDLDSENPYDLPRALDRALASFVRLVSVQGGWLAVRRGDSLEVRAQWDAPSCADLVLSIDANTLLSRMSRNLTPMVVNRGDALWAEIPHKGLKVKYAPVDLCAACHRSAVDRSSCIVADKRIQSVMNGTA